MRRGLMERAAEIPEEEFVGEHATHWGPAQDESRGDYDGWVESLSWEERWTELRTASDGQMQALVKAIANHARLYLTAGRKYRDGLNVEDFVSVEILPKVSYAADLRNRLEDVTLEKISEVLADLNEQLEKVCREHPENDGVPQLVATLSVSSTALLTAVWLEGVEFDVPALGETCKSLLERICSADNTDPMLLYMEVMRCLQETDSGFAASMLGSGIPILLSKILPRLQDQAFVDACLRTLRFLRFNIGTAPSETERPSGFVRGCGELCRAMTGVKFPSVEIREHVVVFTMQAMVHAFEQEFGLKRESELASELALSLGVYGYPDLLSVLNEFTERCRFQPINVSAQSANTVSQTSGRDQLPLWGLQAGGIYVYLALGPLQRELCPELPLLDPLHVARSVAPFCLQLLCDADVQSRLPGVTICKRITDALEARNVVLTEHDAILDPYYCLSIAGEGSCFARIAFRLLDTAASISSSAQRKEIKHVYSALLKRFSRGRARNEVLKYLAERAENNTAGTSICKSVRSELEKSSGQNQGDLARHINATMVRRWLPPREHMMTEIDLVSEVFQVASTVQKLDLLDDETRNLCKASRTALSQLMYLADSDRQNAPKEAEIMTGDVKDKHELFHAARKTFAKGLAALQIADLVISSPTLGHPKLAAST